MPTSVPENSALEPDGGQTASAAPLWPGYIALALVVISFLTIGYHPFKDPDEFYYIGSARYMVQHGDWITPHYNDSPRIRKPILFYWIVAGAFEVFGISVTTARLCSAAGAAGGIALVWLMGNHLLGRRGGLYAALIAAGHLCVAQMTRFATTDTTLWMFCSLAQYGLIRTLFPQSWGNPSESAMDEPPQSSGFSYLFFVGLALALLTKGPVALVWCFAPVLWLVYLRDWKSLGKLPWLRGLLIVAAVVAPWAILFITRNIGQIHRELWNPSSDQSFNHFAGPNYSPVNVVLLLPELLPSVVPWIGLLIVVFGEWKSRGFTGSRRSVGFLSFWLILVLLCLAIANAKSFRYVLALVAPTSLLLGGWFAAVVEKPAMRWPMTKLSAGYGIVLLGTVAPFLVIVACTHGMPTYWLLINAGVQAIIGMLLLWYCRRSWFHAALPALIVSMIYVQSGLVNLTLRPLVGGDFDRLAPQIVRALGPDDPLILYSGITPKSLFFYTQRRLQIVETFDDLLKKLGSARAALLAENDWEKVPDDLRRRYKVESYVEMQKQRSEFHFDLRQNLQEAVFVVRK